MAPRTRYERNLTPPRSLAPHITSFVLYLKSMGRADKTTRMYRQAVEWFAAEYLATGGQPPHAPDTPERYTFDPVTDWADVTRATSADGSLVCSPAATPIPTSTTSTGASSSSSAGSPRTKKSSTSCSA